MKEKITAIISFIIALGWGLFGLFLFFDDGNIHVEEFFTYSTIMVGTVSTVLYVLWTKFGKKEFSELDKINYENQLLKKQIEQKELMKKMKD